MSLEIGLVLGPYQIVAKLGAGGMGEVYRARDQRLGRDVALKVLHGGVVRDVELRRLLQEASASGSLNHPNIVSVYDVNVDAQTPYIVTEFVDGESLHQWIRRGQTPIRKLIDIAVQIADGLAAAHEAAIVHRDLKPANILVNREGRAKIVDFGLAKVAPEGGSAPGDATVSLSSLQVVQGTAEYMSPEQARGIPVDTRSDIFSFGLILYEMASGRRAFSRRSVVETLEAIINADPEPLPERVPLTLQWCIERCLAKDARERYNSTRDLYNELRSIQLHLPETTSTFAPAKAAKVVHRHFPARLWVTLALTGGLLAGGLAMAFRLSRDWPDPTDLRFQPLATGSAWEDRPAWSPQGDLIAYDMVVDGRAQIFTRSLGSPTAVQVTNCPTGCDRPVWTTDARQLFVRLRGGIAEVGAAGGDARPIVPNVEAFTLSPDGQTLAFIRRNPDFSGISVWTASPPTATPVHYQPAPFEGIDAGSGLRVLFTPDGKAMLIWARLFGRGSEFWLLPYPAGSGAPRRVMTSLKNAFPVRGYDWMPGGRRIVLAAALPPDLFRSHLYVADLASGEVHPLVGGPGSEASPTVSPDGRRIAYTAMQYDADIVAIPLDGGAPRDLIATHSLEHSPAWSPAGPELAYVTDRSGVDEIWVRNTVTSRELPIVTPKSFEGGQVEFLTSPLFSPDGQRIAFVRHNRENARRRDATEIWIVPSSGGAPVPLTSLPGAQWVPSWSPDGKWIAFTYQGPPSGLMRVRVGGGDPPEMIWPIDVAISSFGGDWSPRGDWIAVPSKAGVLLISPDGQTRRVLRKPVFQTMAWSHDGATLYGREDAGGQRIVAVDIATGRERVVAEIPSGTSLGGLWFPSQEMRLSPDGKMLAATSIHHSGDIWLLENFQPRSLLGRLFPR